MSTISPFYILSVISSAFSALCFLVGLYRIKTIKGYFIPLFILVSISIIIESMNLAVALSNENNLLLFHLFTVIEFSLIGLFYYLFFKKFSESKYILAGIALFYGVAFFDYKINGLKSLDNISVFFESIALIICSLCSFLYSVKRPVSGNILSAPFFWFNAAVLIYFSGNILLFTFSNYLNKTESTNYYIMWATVHSLINSVYNVLLSIGFWETKIK